MEVFFDHTMYPLKKVFFGFAFKKPIDISVAVISARMIRSELEVLGTPIGAYDLQIAAIAMTNNLTLVTHNTREFKRVHNLLIEDWEIDN